MHGIGIYSEDEHRPSILVQVSNDGTCLATTPNSQTIKGKFWLNLNRQTVYMSKMRFGIVYASLLLCLSATCWSRHPDVYRGTVVHMRTSSELEVLPDQLVGVDRTSGDVSELFSFLFLPSLPLYPLAN